MFKIEDQVSDSGNTTWEVLDTDRKYQLICTCDDKEDAEFILRTLDIQEFYMVLLKAIDQRLIEGEGLDICFYIDDARQKMITRQLLDNMYSAPKQR